MINNLLKLQDNLDLYLTESDRSLSIDNVIFVPNSGVTLKEVGFNNSAQNYIILEGVFENEGVKQHYDSELFLVISANNLLPRLLKEKATAGWEF